jgi:hypothetical protein
MYYDDMDGGNGRGWVLMLIVVNLLIVSAAAPIADRTAERRRHLRHADRPWRNWP